MSSPEPLSENTWIAHNIALLNAAFTAARTSADARQVAQSANTYLRVLEAKDRAAVAALEAIRQEIAASRPASAKKCRATRHA